MKKVEIDPKSTPSSASDEEIDPKSTLSSASDEEIDAKSTPSSASDEEIDPKKWKSTLKASLRYPSKMCDLCHTEHLPEYCNDHRRNTRGEIVRQCLRKRPDDNDLCAPHQHSGTTWKNRPDKKDPFSPNQKHVIADAKRFVELAHVATKLVNEETPGELFQPNAAPIENPVIELARLAGILFRAFEAAGERVNNLTSLSVETRAGGEQLRGEVVLWEKLIGHLRVMLNDMAKLNLEERLVRVEEKRADIVAEQLYWFQASIVKALELDTVKTAVVGQLLQTTVQRIVEYDSTGSELIEYATTPRADRRI